MSTILAPEDKLVSKIVSILEADTIIAGYVAGRIYSSHISSIQEPVFPAISIFTLSVKPRFEAPESVSVSFQIDAWMPFSKYTNMDISALSRRIRVLLHRANLSDSTIPLIVGQCVGPTAGPLMYEEDTDLLHFPSIFNAEIL
jgi:hypothetical protein